MRDPHDPDGEYDITHGWAMAPCPPKPYIKRTPVAPGNADSNVNTLLDDVFAPAHYTYGNKECIEFIKAIGEKPGYCIGNAMKYIYRHKHKGDPAGDIRKAIRCLQMYLEDIEEANDE